ncbi:MAG: 2-oxoglutarate and iron-dependent oxygenase domain-containing protein [Pseudomonadota bacterium]
MGQNPLPDRLLAKRESFDRIPVVDLAGLLDGTDKQGVARAIHHALRTSGFMYVKNHGVDADFVARVFDVTRAFFDLPLDDKMALHISNSGAALRGYIEVFGENTDPEKTKDLKECFDIGPERAAVSPFFGPNPWPASLPEFGRLTYEYHQQMVVMAKHMLRGIALSLELAEDYFADKTRDPISIQRMLHYPPQDRVEDESVMGIGAHTDYGNLTILAQDDVGGLQVMNRDGDWVEAPPIPGTFVINIGDLIQRLTNDVYLANLHRVINTTGRERYSIPFFLDADFDAVFGPLDSCITPDNPRVYEPVACGEHKFSRFKTSYAHLADV